MWFWGISQLHLVLKVLFLQVNHRHPLLHLQQRFKVLSTTVTMALSLLASFQTEGFNQTGEKEDGESSFLSDSALRSAGFPEKRDFPFSSLQHGFSLLFLLHSTSFHCLCHPPLHVHPISPPPCHCPDLLVLFFFPCGCGWRSLSTLAFSLEREAGKGTEGGTVRIAEARLSTVLCRHHFWLQIWLGKFGRTYGVTDCPRMLKASTVRCAQRQTRGWPPQT